MQDLSLQAIGPGNDDNSSVPISANGNIMEINLYSLAKNNNGEIKLMMECALVDVCWCVCVCIVDCMCHMDILRFCSSCPPDTQWVGRSPESPIF